MSSAEIATYALCKNLVLHVICAMCVICSIFVKYGQIQVKKRLFTGKIYGREELTYSISE